MKEQPPENWHLGVFPRLWPSAPLLASQAAPEKGGGVSEEGPAGLSGTDRAWEGAAFLPLLGRLGGEHI
jgi:hypothetical protein